MRIRLSVASHRSELGTHKEASHGLVILTLYSRSVLLNGNLMVDLILRCIQQQQQQQQQEQE